MQKSKLQSADIAATIAQQNATTIQSITDGEKSPQITVSGTNNSLQIRLPDAVNYRHTVTETTAERAAETLQDKETSIFKTKLPLSVALILAAAGIVAICFAVKYARRTSPAVDAAIGFADSHLASGIANLESWAARETDVAKLAMVNQQKAELEKIRGKVNAYDSSTNNR